MPSRLSLGDSKHSHVNDEDQPAQAACSRVSIFVQVSFPGVSLEGCLSIKLSVCVPLILTYTPAQKMSFYLYIKPAFLHEVVI